MILVALLQADLVLFRNVRLLCYGCLLIVFDSVVWIWVGLVF